MKYTVEIEIDSPIDKVIELFDNPDNMDKRMDCYWYEKWLKDYLSFGDKK